MDRHRRPDVTAMTREELKRYGRSGRHQDIDVSLELIRRHHIRMDATRCVSRPGNVVPFRRKGDEEGGIA